MHIECKVSNKVIVKIEADDVLAAFAGLSEAQAIFGHSKCGKCGSENIVFDFHEFDGNPYYSMQCKAQGCRAKLDFGKLKAGGLFVKLKDKAGNWIPNEGWHIYSRQEATQPDDPFA